MEWGAGPHPPLQAKCFFLGSAGMPLGAAPAKDRGKRVDITTTSTSLGQDNTEACPTLLPKENRLEKVPLLAPLPYATAALPGVTSPISHLPINPRMCF